MGLGHFAFQVFMKMLSLVLSYLNELEPMNFYRIFAWACGL